jgi:hypothetical protein
MTDEVVRSETMCCVVGGGPAGVVLALRLLLRLPLLRNLPARIIGIGLRRVHVKP